MRRQTQSRENENEATDDYTPNEIIEYGDSDDYDTDTDTGSSEEGECEDDANKAQEPIFSKKKGF